MATASVVAGEELGPHGFGFTLVQLRDDGDQSLYRADSNSRMFLTVRHEHSVEVLAFGSGVVRAGIDIRRGDVLGHEEDVRPLPGADMREEHVGATDGGVGKRSGLPLDTPPYERPTLP
jgi:hypothetical protein